MDSLKRSPDRLFDGILLLSDLDGTLLNRKKTIPERNLEAIRRFTARGGRFTIATGRCPRSAERIAEAAGVNSPVVTLNGAVVYDFQADRAASQVVLPSSYPEIVRRVHAAFPHIGVQVYIGSWIYVANTDPIVERLFRLEHTERYRRAVSMDALPAEANKVLFGGQNEELQKVRAFLEGALHGMYGMFTEDVYYELLPNHTNKGTGVRSVVEVCGVDPANVAAVGDYYNDVDILKTVAYPIVAGNAPDDVKMFARFITGDCDDGVVADAIEHLEQRLTAYGRL